jgi:hypothetical protein
MPYLTIVMSVVTVVIIGTARPPAVSIAVGGDQTTQLRYFDDPFITNFNPPEPQQWPTTEQPRRWSKSAWRISWPNAGHGWWISHISVNTTPRPRDNQAQIEFITPHMSGVVLPNQIRHVQLLTQSKNETPLVAARMTPLKIAGDNRDLGIVMTQIGLTPLGSIVRVQLMIALVVLLTFVGLSSRILIPHFWWIGVMGSTLLIISTVHTHADWWLVHTHTVIASSLAGMGILVIPLIKKHTAPPPSTWGIVGIGVAVQLAILNSPWLRSSDIAMHIRMLNQVLKGDLLFTAQLPCEAGGQLAPYPIISYLLATPLAILSDERWWHLALLQSGAIFAHAIAILYAARVLQHYRLSPLQLVFWSGFAISSPFLIRALHIGEISNAWAHALYIIAVMSWFDPSRHWRSRLLLSTLVILSHTGISITYLATMAMYVVWQWMSTRIFPRTTLMVVITSVVIGGMLYYSQFITTVLGSPVIAGCPPLYPLSVRYSTIGDGWSWALIVSALCGIGLSNRGLIRQIIGIGGGAAVVALAMLLIRDQTVRWALALVPFVALSASIWLAQIAQKQVAGRVLAASALLFGVWVIYVERWEQVVLYLHD